MTFEWNELMIEKRFADARYRINKRIDRHVASVKFELDLIHKAAMLSIGIEADGQLRMFK